jgi:glucosamine 6-phosphate synthetase-like amidotransferase/phosphosugar isomerase protein
MTELDKSRSKTKKRMQKYVHEFKQKFAQEKRKRKHEELLAVITKNKIETYDDIIAIFNGLSRKAKDSAVLCRIYSLAKLGESPTEIIKAMVPKK